MEPSTFKFLKDAARSESGPADRPLTRGERLRALGTALVFVGVYSFGFFMFFYPTTHPLEWAKPIFVAVYILLPIWIWPFVYGLFIVALSREPEVKA